MIFGNLNGKRPNVKVVIHAPSDKQSTPRRHPYVTAVLVVAVASLSVFVARWLFDFPPMILFAVAVAFCFQVLGIRSGLFALLLAVLTADFFFVEPLLTLTRHSFILGLYYLTAAAASLFFTRKMIRH
jgi:K+-sensing histidine kinase KdpD